MSPSVIKGPCLANPINISQERYRFFICNFFMSFTIYLEFVKSFINNLKRHLIQIYLLTDHLSLMILSRYPLPLSVKIALRNEASLDSQIKVSSIEL